MSSNQPMLGIGAYSLREASQFVNAKRGTASRWFFGRTALLHSALEAVGKDKAITFLSLIEFLVVMRLRDRGLSLQRIRRLHSRAEKRFGPHPFARWPRIDGVDYDADGVAERWRIAKGVVVDPRRCFGKPIVDEAAVTTRVLAASFRANEYDVPFVADLFEVSDRAVRNAAAFERRMAA